MTGPGAAWHGPASTIGDSPDPAGLPEESAAQRAALSEGLLSAAELDLAQALRTRVAVVGAAGPPPGSLARIRRKARTRQRNRMVLAGSAGVLMLAMAVTMATGDRFDIVPTLTGAVGLGGGSGASGQNGASGSSNAATAGNGGHAVWPTGTGGKSGLAIGPVGPVVATPSAAAAAKVPLCTADLLKTATTLGPTVRGVEYAHVDAIAQSPCVVVGPPVLTVANEAGTARSSVEILKEDLTQAALLPAVPTWGTAMVLKTGQAYQFQFAWASAPCSQDALTPSPSPSASLNSMYFLGYAVTGTTPTGVVALTANCGAKVYVTDIYAPGAFPLPKAPVPPPPVTSSSPAAPPPSSPAPPSASVTTPPADTTSAAPSASAADPNPGAGGGGGSSGGTGSGNATSSTG
ncbi:MAG TPA: hypothetical protein VFU74_16395 [Actinocrinis sp.]|nr:hypothetical protein [Actinocrinis sp.]